jgi:hypothetical protein
MSVVVFGSFLGTNTLKRESSSEKGSAAGLGQDRRTRQRENLLSPTPPWPHAPPRRGKTPSYSPHPRILHHPSASDQRQAKKGAERLAGSLGGESRMEERRRFTEGVLLSDPRLFRRCKAQGELSRSIRPKRYGGHGRRTWKDPRLAAHPSPFFPSTSIIPYYGRQAHPRVHRKDSRHLERGSERAEDFRGSYIRTTVALAFLVHLLTCVLTLVAAYSPGLSLALL